MPRRFLSNSMLALAALALTGCVERRLTIRTDPPSALVRLDGREIGFTPISVPFTYYGNRRVQIVKDGFETMTIDQPINTPWYQYFPLDFITEVLVPWNIRDEREYEYVMEPARGASVDELQARARSVREQALVPPEDAARRPGLLERLRRPANERDAPARGE